MSCSILRDNLHSCRNWCVEGRSVCHAHQTVDPLIQKKRWFQRYILGSSEFLVYTFLNPTHEKKILSDLTSRRIELTKEDILSIPDDNRYLDVYMMLLEHGFLQRGTHVALEKSILDYYCFLLAQFPDHDLMPRMRTTIENAMILDSGKTLYTFLMWLPNALTHRERLTQVMIGHIPKMLDTDAAKELSWMSYSDLDTLRIHYEAILGKNHPITKYLVQRWLLDLKELYQTEKAIQKIKMDCCKEELMMNRWHPDRIEALLYQGIDPSDM
jgi:hypothetical protein